jgi:protein-disulfide isomerase
MYLRLIGIAIVILSVIIGWKFYVSYTAFDKLQMAPHHQYVGAENPSVIITEIMDYRCAYCRQMHDVMTAFVALHPEVRVIYRVYPIYNEPSMVEAKLAMAAGNQGKFVEMHNKLIRRDDPVTPEVEAALIAELGLNKEQFEKDKFSWSATKDLLDATAAVNALNINATPTLIVDRKVYLPRAAITSVKELEELLAAHLKPAMSTAPAQETVP